MSDADDIDEDALPRRRELRAELQAARTALAEASTAMTAHDWRNEPDEHERRWKAAQQASERLSRARIQIESHVFWYGGDIEAELREPT